MIKWFHPSFWGKEKKYVQDALDSGWISDGEYIRKFEKVFADYLGISNAMTVSNGTTALYLALLALKIGPGDEVIVPGYTFAAPANMVLATGAKPVFVDIDPDTWLLSSEKLESQITKNTKAIIPVHIYGNVCAMDSIKEVAKEYNLAIIEDVAEAAFSKYSNQYAGTFGDFGCFSFQATKTISMGEGGAVITNNAELADMAKVIRNHGMRPEKRYWHEVVGHNFRLTNYQAALGYGQLEKVEDIIANKKRVYNSYKERLDNVAGITLQQIKNQVDPVMWAVVVKIDKNFFKGDRDFVRQILLDKGIETRGGFYSFSAMPLYRAKKLPVSELISENIISLPSYASLDSDKINYICDQFLSLKKE
ncbi:GDP-perosamine synthase [Gammaproteobacteria bacterium]